MEEANEKRLIIVKQLPEFEEHLHLIKEEAEKRVADAMQMVVSEETVKTVKKVRAELNSEFNALEQSRIAAKKAVMEPYEKRFIRPALRMCMVRQTSNWAARLQMLRTA